MYKLPILCKIISGWDDHKIVSALLLYQPIPTEEFFYGKCYPIFKCLHSRFSINDEIWDFIQDMYLDVIQPRNDGKCCKLKTFQFRCALHNWIGCLSLHYCIEHFSKRGAVIDFIDIGDRNEGQKHSLFETISIMEMYDVEKLIGMMPNERYRNIIRLRYLEGYSNEETAEKLGMEMSNFYNKHLLAKAQYLAVYKQEMGI